MRVVLQQGIAVLDVVEIAQNRFGQIEAAIDPVMPLQEADPQHHLRNSGGARVDLQTEKLLRVDGLTGHRQHGLSLAQVVKPVAHLAFEALQMLQGDIQKVAAAAGRVEDAQAAQLVMEGADFLAGLLGLALLQPGLGGDLNRGPVAAQRRDDGRQHQPFDVGAGGVVRAELMPFARIEGALQQGAENRRFDEPPVGPAGGDQLVDLLGAQRDRVGVGEQTAVEPPQPLQEVAVVLAVVHVVPQAL